jgi:lipopolysaccharide export system protein LptA
MRLMVVIACLLAALPAMAQQQHPSLRNTPVDISADRLDVDQDKQEATFSGNVKVEQGGLLLNADTLTVYYNARNTGGRDMAQAVRRIVADGQAVTVVYGQDTATGKQAVYDVQQASVELTGGVVLVRGGNTLKGDRLVFNLTTGKVSLLSSGSERVRAQFTPNVSR